MKTTLVKSQLLHHNKFFPINSKTAPKSSSFNLPPYYTPAFVRKVNLCLSSKTEYWVQKSHHEEEDIADNYTFASNNETSSAGTDANDDDDKELKSSTSTQVLITGAASIGFLLVLMGQDKAWALGPEGPMVEEFWENVRRYGLYALTVSTGVLYAVLQPIVELLKNPISAILIILIIGGSFFIFSQILSAMFGVSDFAYQYAY